MNQWGQTLWLTFAGAASSLADRLEAFQRLLAALTSLRHTLRPPAADRCRTSRLAEPAQAYETVCLDLSLVLEDALGERATLTRRQRLRFPKGRASLVRELVWGEGQQLIRYQAKGARRVALRAEGSKRAVLLEPVAAATLGRAVTITSRRSIQGGFAAPEEYCEALLERPTGRVRFDVLFPLSRPPRAAWLVCAAPETVLRSVPVRYGAGGRARLRCSVRSPLVGMTYSLRWSW